MVPVSFCSIINLQEIDGDSEVRNYSLRSMSKCQLIQCRVGSFSSERDFKFPIVATIKKLTTNFSQLLFLCTHEVCVAVCGSDLVTFDPMHGALPII